MTSKKIVILAGKGTSTKIIFHALNERFGIHTIIIENSVSKLSLIGRRIKRLGVLTVVGQLMFQITVPKILNFFSKKRVKQIIKEGGINLNEIPNSKLAIVNSINDSGTIELLSKISPDLIIVNGTRIISKKVLNAISCKFINTHVGITPKYRGVHGMYWALVNSDQLNSGVTIHFVDEGIDTGLIIDQIQVLPSNDDNFVTYPLLQTVYGTKILLKAVENYFNNSITTKVTDGESRLWYHPTLYQYIFYRLVKSVK